jgi:hypothetical protein
MCNKGTIVATKVYRVGKAGANFGYILLISSSLGLLLAVLNYLRSLEPVRGDFQVLQEIQRSFAQSGAFLIGFLSFVGAFIGWLLVRKKMVLKCNQCGVEVPDSLIGRYDRAT